MIEPNTGDLPKVWARERMRLVLRAHGVEPADDLVENLLWASGREDAAPVGWVRVDLEGCVGSAAPGGREG